MKSQRPVVSLVAGLLAIGAAAPRPARAADPAATAPAPATTAPAAMEVHIVQVHGLVQVRGGMDQPWQRAQAGMVVGAGAAFRTGPRSSVTCTIPPDQTFTLDRLGTIEVLEALKQGNTIKTDLIMRYGRTHYDIESAGAEHQATIRTPGSTLAVRGTNVSVYDQPPFAPQAESFTGRARYSAGGHSSTLGGNQYARIDSGLGTAAETALASSVVDPSIARARTGPEAALVAAQVSLGSLSPFDRSNSFPTVRDTTPPADAQLSSFLTDRLDLVVRWSGNADINLSAVQKSGDQAAALSSLQAGSRPDAFLYPAAGLNRESGGAIAYNNVGGRTGGMEIAAWPAGVPAGVYGVSATSIRGANSTVKFNAYLDGKPIELLAYLVDDFGQIVHDSHNAAILVKNTQIQRALASGQSVSAIILVPPNAAIQQQIPAEPRSGGTGETGQVVVPATVQPVKAAVTVQPSLRGR